MAKKKNNEILVGITVLISFVLLVYIIVTLADWDNLFTEKNHITFKVPYHVGLKGITQGSPVTLGGAKIGQVIRTDIQPNSAVENAAKPLAVSFTIEIPTGYPLTSECVLAAQSNMLGGQAILAIKELGETGHLLADNETVKLANLEGGFSDVMQTIKNELSSENPQSLLGRLQYELNREAQDSLMNHLVKTTSNIENLTMKMDQELSMSPKEDTLRSKVHNLLDQAQLALDQINHELDQTQEASTIQQIGLAMKNLNQALDQVNELIQANGQPATETIASLHSITRQVDEQTPELLAKSQQVLDKMQETLTHASVNLTEAEKLIANINQEFNFNKTLIQRIISNLNEMSVNLNMTSREIRRAPWKLLYRPDGKEVKYQAIVDSTENFVTGAERLDELAVRLKTLLKGPATVENQQRIQHILDELDETFKVYQQAEKQLWQVLE